MIDIVRSPDPPPSLAEKKSHRGRDVLEQLAHDFLDKCYLCEKPVRHLNFEVDHRKPKAAGQFPQLEFEWTNLFPACHDCNHRRPRKYPPDGLLDPGGGTRLEERLLQQWDSEHEVAVFAAAASDDLQARHTAKELLHLHNAPDPQAADLRAAISRHLNRVLEEIARYLQLLLGAAGQKTPEIELVEVRIQLLVSRQAPYTMLIRSRVKDYVGHLFD